MWKKIEEAQKHLSNAASEEMELFFTRLLDSLVEEAQEEQFIRDEMLYQER